MSDENKSCCNASNGEPAVKRSAAPMWIIVVTLTLLFFGGLYLDSHGGWFNARVYSPYNSAERLESFQPQTGAGAVAAQGKRVYEAVCGICHGNDGAGKPGQAPPVAGSEWVLAKGANRLVHIPLEGLSGSLMVKGKEWNLNMAAMGVALSDSDLAAVLSYLRTSWGNQAGEVTADDVKKIRDAIGSHPQPMTGDQLMKMPE
ncbi:MAG: cytochrome c [Verrucomicrobiota bacterium]|jgi:mono/diheme cytochrome c family protein